MFPSKFPSSRDLDELTTQLKLLRKDAQELTRAIWALIMEMRDK